MKKLWTILVTTLALNFLVAAGGISWLWYSGALDRQKVMSIRKVLFPPPAPAQEPLAATRPDPTTQPTLRLEELLARQAGHPVSDQVGFIQQTFDAQMALLDRRRRDLTALNAQVEDARKKMSEDRAALEEDRRKLASEQSQATRLQNDKGFQDSLLLYTTMPGKQVKTIFLTLDDQTIVQYLQAMQPRTAGRIIKEFKAPDELERIQRVLEKMRQAQASTKE